MLLVSDASILVDSYLDTEERHAKANAFVLDAALGKHELVLPTTCLIEVVAALTRRSTDPDQGKLSIARAKRELLTTLP